MMRAVIFPKILTTKIFGMWCYKTFGPVTRVRNFKNVEQLENISSCGVNFH